MKKYCNPLVAEVESVFLITFRSVNNMSKFLISVVNDRRVVIKNITKFKQHVKHTEQEKQQHVWETI